MNELPTIPIPFSARLRELRIRFLPPVAFLAVVASVALVWHDSLQLSTIAAVGEGIRSSLSAPQAGTVQSLKVEPFQIVQKGEPLAVIMPSDPNAPLELLRSQIQLAQLQMQPSVAEQNALDYERVRMELMRTKTELSIAKVNLERAESEVRRSEPLVKAQITTVDAFELMQATRDAYRADVAEKSTNVVLIEQRMEQLRALGDPEKSLSNTNFAALISQLSRAQESMTTNWGPITLYAPITGMVTAISRVEGEYIGEGECLVMLSGLYADRVVAYLRQPYGLEPQIGMSVQITTRDVKRTRFVTEIAQIGAQMEVITNALAYLRQGSLVDVGLPIVVKIPPDKRIRPGEVVDFYIQKNRTPGAFTPKVVSARKTGEGADNL